MEKKLYVIGLETEADKTKSEEVVNGLEGVSSTIANCEKAQILVNYDESVADIEAQIKTALEGAGISVLN
ncbi:MAG TPA: heavy metal transporter [Treponemataceae bacterium]|nr:heavy metal transporter [Treponemataceae bacterium]